MGQKHSKPETDKPSFHRLFHCFSNKRPKSRSKSTSRMDGSTTDHTRPSNGPRMGRTKANSHKARRQRHHSHRQPRKLALRENDHVLDRRDPLREGGLGAAEAGLGSSIRTKRYAERSTAVQERKTSRPCPKPTQQEEVKMSERQHQTENRHQTRDECILNTHRKSIIHTAQPPPPPTHPFETSSSLLVSYDDRESRLSSLTTHLITNKFSDHTIIADSVDSRVWWRPFSPPTMSMEEGISWGTRTASPPPSDDFRSITSAFVREQVREVLSRAYNFNGPRWTMSEVDTEEGKEDTPWNSPSPSVSPSPTFDPQRTISNTSTPQTEEPTAQDCHSPPPSPSPSPYSSSPNPSTLTDSTFLLPPAPLPNWSIIGNHPLDTPSASPCPSLSSLYERSYDRYQRLDRGPTTQVRNGGNETFSRVPLGVVFDGEGEEYNGARLRKRAGMQFLIRFIL
ncbi:hypothetical protein P154DRAFT_569721 [Amniculicola lignicola CBS 123094]|uniref:Uncharacterized protein n=1 Tax=Amniculicola lignicola CBS 123094 TaxID=1392246 RepID=A0A6A5X1N0_9PLEO|nr:hypothetical protein P154DRAFT_569721 [Amniculicola lignicola CBS 123094]